MYRIEVNVNNIGPILETPFSLNPLRTEVSNNPIIWNLLEVLVDISMRNNISLFDVCNAAIGQKPILANFLPGIWEVLMEKARPATVPIKRTECAFFFHNIEDAIHYKDTYPGMGIGVPCEVVIIKQDYMLECDMKWLDDINENIVTASGVIERFGHYWKSERTENPVIEILFSGKYQLSPIA